MEYNRIDSLTESDFTEISDFILRPHEKSAHIFLQN